MVRVDLTSEDALALAALVDAANEDLSPAPGVPFSPWLDVAEAAAFAGVQPGTLRGWLARGGPKKCPFPLPDRPSRAAATGRKGICVPGEPDTAVSNGAHAPRDRLHSRLRALQVGGPREVPIWAIR